MAEPELVYALATRPHPSEQLNGDAAHVRCVGPRWRFVVVDGLGHGPEAARAASAIVTSLETAPMDDVDGILLHCHVAAKETRGAAVSIALVDLERQLLTFGGIGNVEGRLRVGGRESRLVPARGIIGAAVRKAHPTTFELRPPWLLVLHSDGLASRLKLDWDEDQPVDEDALQRLADSALANWGRQSDDATVLLAAPNSRSPRQAG